MTVGGLGDGFNAKWSLNGQKKQKKESLWSAPSGEAEGRLAKRKLVGGLYDKRLHLYACE